jgi:Transposase DDE domain
MLQGCFFRRLVELRTRCACAPELPFAEVLQAASIQAILDELKVEYRDRIYTPLVTLWVFVSQVLDADPSCRQAVSRLLAHRTQRGLPACSTDSGSYCTARKKLPEALLERLMQKTGRELEQQAPAEWDFHGRKVKLADGATVSMPDTAENTAAFDKPRNQRGPGPFPVARILVLLALATGAALEAAIGPCRGKKTGELSLFRSLHHTLEPGDLVLADRLFCTFCDIAKLLAQGVDCVFRLSSSRSADFRRGQRLGQDDHLVTWSKPKQCPEGMSAAEFAELPDQLQVREVRVTVNVPGFRVKSLVVVTTLLDPLEFPPDEIAALFRQRWQAELHLRSLKTVLGMDVLRCLTPEMVRKEIWAHLLAYNLLRSMLCAAAVESDRPVCTFSFKASLQLLSAFRHELLDSLADDARLRHCCDLILQALSEHRVHDRLNRYEPRKRKRPPKPFPQLKRPRHVERNLCRQNRSD